MKSICENYDVVVVGGGLAGMCAAITAAREGSKTVLVHNRPMLGGNACSEVRMHICGADRHSSRPNARETGLLEEILLEHKHRNPENSYPIFDSILWEKAAFQKNLTLHLNSYMYQTEAKDGKISGIRVQQMGTEKEYVITGKIFVDATGDGMLSEQAGAEYTAGREGKDVYGEKYAPDVTDHYTMGNSLMFHATDKGHPVPFVAPAWANHYTEEELKLRDHKQVTSGYWWIELGGSDLNTIDDAEILRDDLMSAVYGMWDHIKNGGDHGAENLELDWVQMLPGKRESRRVFGDYVLKEQDCFSGARFEDTVAYGGWPMDVHVIDGFKTHSEEPTINLFLDDVYAIPYRCYYSRNVENLMLAGRIISCSHMAFASSRVMATCAVGGEAVGVAAAMAAAQNITPREVGKEIKKVQLRLQQLDCYLPGVVCEDADDFASRATVTASDFIPGAEPENVLNGVSRQVGDALNCWQSASGEDAWIQLNFCKPEGISKLQCIFDSNLNQQITISNSDALLSYEEKTTPSTLVSDFEVVCCKNGEVVHSQKIEGNYVRNCWVQFPETVLCDSIRLRIVKTHGVKSAKIYTLRAY